MINNFIYMTSSHASIYSYAFNLHACINSAVSWHHTSM